MTAGWWHNKALHGRFRGVGEFQGLPPARLQISGTDFGKELGPLRYTG